MLKMIMKKLLIFKSVEVNLVSICLNHLIETSCYFNWRNSLKQIFVTFFHRSDWRGKWYSSFRGVWLFSYWNDSLQSEGWWRSVEAGNRAEVREESKWFWREGQNNSHCFTQKHVDEERISCIHCVVSFLLFKRMKQRMEGRRDPKTPKQHTEATEGIESIQTRVSRGDQSTANHYYEKREKRRRKKIEKAGKKVGRCRKHSM